MLKGFSEWFGLKTKLHERHQTPPFVSEREIWWASVGENVGSEINGKSAPFSRTVIIYKKLSHGFYFVIPTTTQKRGVPLGHRPLLVARSITVRQYDVK